MGTVDVIFTSYVALVGTVFIQMHLPCICILLLMYLFIAGQKNCHRVRDVMDHDLGDLCHHGRPSRLSTEDEGNTSCSTSIFFIECSFPVQNTILQYVTVPD